MNSERRRAERQRAPVNQFTTKENDMIDRNTSGVRETLFRELESLREGTSTPQRATAVAKLCAQIVHSAKLDIDYQRFVSEGGDKVVSLKSTKLVA